MKELPWDLRGLGFSATYYHMHMGCEKFREIRRSDSVTREPNMKARYQMLYDHIDSCETCQVNWAVARMSK